MRLNLRRIFRLNLRAVKSRSILASESIGMSAYPDSPPPSDPADVFWIWIRTACFSAGARPDGSPPAYPPGGRRRSSPAHTPGCSDRSSWCGRDRTGSSDKGGLFIDPTRLTVQVTENHRVIDGYFREQIGRAAQGVLAGHEGQRRAGRPRAIA